MKFKKLGHTDIDVSLICLGTMNMGEQNTQAEGFEQMDYSLEKGVNFFDTAEVYAVPPRKETQGKTEEIIGNWFVKRKKREKIILATKMVGPGVEWIRNGGGNYNEENMSASIDGSLKRLQTNYIDLYQLHWPERNTNFFGKRNYEHVLKEEKWNDFESVLRALKKLALGPLGDPHAYIGIFGTMPSNFRESCLAPLDSDHRYTAAHALSGVHDVALGNEMLSTRGEGKTSSVFDRPLVRDNKAARAMLSSTNLVLSFKEAKGVPLPETEVQRSSIRGRRVRVCLMRGGRSTVGGSVASEGKTAEVDENEGE